MTRRDIYGTRARLYRLIVAAVAAGRMDRAWQLLAVLRSWR